MAVPEKIPRVAAQQNVHIWYRVVSIMDWRIENWLAAQAAKLEDHWRF